MFRFLNGFLCVVFCSLAFGQGASAQVGVDVSDPWYPDRKSPRLVTPQWVGEDGVECVVVLAIDDMRDTAKYEQYLRPILNRLKQIDGRAPVSIMTNEVKPNDPQLQSWLEEGLSIECHTIDHPCPILQGGDFDKAKSTYDRCVDLLAKIPGSRPVAFRTPCCDSLNTVSPRFYSEVFPHTTADGNFLQIDSSVMNFFTSEDASIPRELVLDENGEERFWKYKVKGLKQGKTVHDNFVNYITNYPYPYVINNTCWQFPCVAPSDWSAQHLHGINNQQTVDDWKAALDITVCKQGVFNLVFHPHGWIKAEQVVELIDHAVAKHGSKVKFLNFREAVGRLNENLLQRNPVRDSSGTENGVRVLDVDQDGFQDVVFGNAVRNETRVWQPNAQSWEELSFPAFITNQTHFTKVRKNGPISVLTAGADKKEQASYFHADGWKKDPLLQDLVSSSAAARNAPMEVLDEGIASQAPPATRRWRFHDIDHDGADEAIVTWTPVAEGGESASLTKQDIQIFRTSRATPRPSIRTQKPVGDSPLTWRRLRFPWPTGSAVPSSGLDPMDFGLVDINRDGFDDLIGSSVHGTYVALFDDFEYGWTKTVLNVSSDNSRALPPIRTVGGSDNGFFIHDAGLYWVNEFTADQPDLVFQISFDELVAQPENKEVLKVQPPVPIGAAAIDITPGYPVRLSGYGNRTEETAVVASKIHARALVIGRATVDSSNSAAKQQQSVGPRLSGDDDDSLHPLSILLTVDNCGVPQNVTEAVFGILAEQFSLARERFAVSSSHSHSAPWLRGFAPNILTDVSDDHAGHLADYEAWLIEQLVQVAADAISQRRPGRLSMGRGTLDFAINRRLTKSGQWTGFGETPEAPVDHQMPLLAAHDTDGKLIAVLANYACHATTETGGLNSISGDWPGIACNLIEADNPGSVALVAIGCGADSNPSPRGTHELAEQHARSVATEVQRLLKHLAPIDHQIDCQIAHVDLPLGPLPSRKEWEAKAKEPKHAGEHGRMFLKMLAEGKPIPTTIPSYPVQTWCFGKDLAMVFLGGEVVIDYSVRMNEMFDSDRLWINAYCNDVPCYIASKRILREGGYEADRSMIYYARPTRLAPEAEDLICDTVQKLLPHHFYSKELRASFPGPRSPEDSLSAITVRPGLRAELVASEPFISDPVAFDWDINGRLWVVEMGGYPSRRAATTSRQAMADKAGTLQGTQSATGMMNKEAKNSGGGVGRVRVLEDTNGDGRYDAAVTFLDGLSFPTGLHPWRNGWLVTCAPDIIYAEDTDGDFVADKQTVLYTGFTEGNQQHRVNGLRWGLDGWLYLANGDSGGEVQSVGSILNQEPGSFNRSINTRGRDIRIQPDTGAIETLSGQTQSGRNRDDFGNWFGNNNSNPIWHYVLEDHDLRRNPFATGIETKAQVAEIPGAAPVYPISKTLARFNDFHAANRFTSACSTAIYRDNVLGEEFYGNAFTCEPVHNLVSRLVLERDEVTFKGRRAADERESEFFASSDNWTRPVMVRTGPDGALYVADMYRQVIEHPQWIPAEYQRKMDLYAGSGMGRIYRVVRDAPIAQESSGYAVSSGCCGNANVAADVGESEINRSSPTWLNESWQDVETQPLHNRLKSSNGWWRDTVQRLLQHRKDTTPIEWWGDSQHQDVTIAARVQSMFAVANRAPTSNETLNLLLEGLRSPDAELRLAAVKLLAPILAQPDFIPHREMLTLAGSDFAPMQRQLALSLGFSRHESAASTLATLMTDHLDSPAVVDAVMTSLTEDNIGAVLHKTLETKAKPNGRQVSLALLKQAGSFGRIELLSAELARQLAVMSPDTTPDELAFAKQLLAQIVNPQIREHIMARCFESFRSAAEVAIDLATDRSCSSIHRAAAVRFLTELQTIAPQSLQGHQEIRPEDFLKPHEAVELQFAAIEMMALHPDRNLVTNFFLSWNEFTPRVFDHAAKTVLQREELVRVMLQAIEAGQINSSLFSGQHRSSLINHRQADIADAAAKIFSEDISATRTEVVDLHRMQLSKLKGDPSTGRTVFEKRCSACHRLEGVGKQIGADLAALKDRSTDALLTAILDPNRAVEAKFLSYTAVTKSGRSFSGMLLNETGNSLTLLGTDGKQQIVARTDLDELVCGNRSLMPEGLEKDLSAQDLANVIRFVQKSGSTFKRFDGNSPHMVTPSADGTITLSAQAAEIYGPSLIFEDKHQNLGWWSSSDDYAVWHLNSPRSGLWTVEIDYACDNSTAGNVLKLSTGTRLLSARVPGTGTWDDYKTWTVGKIDLGRGARKLIVTAPEKPNLALIDLKAIRLTPPQ